MVKVSVKLLHEVIFRYGHLTLMDSRRYGNASDITREHIDELVKRDERGREKVCWSPRSRKLLHYSVLRSHPEKHILSH